MTNYAYQYLHASIDDVLWIFKDITEHSYKSVFDNKILGWMKEMHNLYGAAFTCYCFYNAWYDFSLDMTTDRYSKELSENADWLKFGFHGYGFDDNHTDRTYECRSSKKSLIEDFVLVTGELSRIASADNIDSALRLSSFLGCRGGITYLAKHYNLKTLFCAETSEKPSYYLTRRQLHQLDRTGVVKDAWNHVNFYKSDIRVEHIHSFDETKGYLESVRGGAARRVAVFTHEWAMLDDWKKVSNNFENVIAYCLGIVNK